jgi:nucleotide-binding universal stress UspA family protein
MMKMALKSVFTGLVCQEAPLPAEVVRYAISLAAHERAHLSVAIAAPRLTAPSPIPVAAIHGLVTGANRERDKHAKDAAAQFARDAEMAGVTIDVETWHEAFPAARQKLLRHARAADIVVLPRAGDLLSLDRDIVEEMLFNSGRPTVIVPPGWDKPFACRRLMVAWDGGARAARAVGDAMRFIEQAASVEIVCVSARTENAKDLEGAEIARHLARHAKAVTLTELTAKESDVGHTLRSHALAQGTDLVIMGGYAHSRLKQLLLGGVTTSLLGGAELPVLVSY